MSQDDRAVAYECDYKPRELVPAAGPGLWGWSAALPVDTCHAVSLSEGNTPLVRLPRVARDVGVAKLYVKNEAANPTGSHKDRLPPLAIAFALQLLLPRGLIAVAHQPRGPGASDEVSAATGREIAAALVRAGFSRVRVETMRLRPAVVCALGVNGAGA
jgi:threonine synthase